jgi:Protein of unknown function (DUF1565)
MRLRAITTALAMALTPLAGVAGTAPAHAAATTYHVATTGSDRNPGTSSKPFRSVQRAVDAAKPGTSVLVHKGTYAGQVKIRQSGTATAPITLRPAGDGPVTLTSSPTAVSCGSRQPAAQRTIMIGGGADHWTIRGFTIVNGVHIFGREGNAAYSYLTNLVKSENWRARRAIPGRGVNDPVAARSALGYLRTKTGRDLDPSDGIEISGNTITRRGIHAAFSRYGKITGNTIHSIDCGTGPGVWLVTFSDGWTVSDNFIHHVAPSTAAHFMQEGIRLGSASNYNVVQKNVVEDLPGDGRAFNTDVDSSYNTFQTNVARRVAIGYNDQMSGWGNRWLYNRVEGFRTYGFGFRLMDGGLSRPSMHSSTNGAVVRCNTASGTGADLGVGASMGSAFSSNAFSPVYLSKNLQSYWSAEDNTWNGSTKAPSTTPSTRTTGC